MRKRIERIVGPMVLAAALCSGAALADQNIAAVSHKGSLLIFPEINVDPKFGANTIIEISNDQTTSVHIECSYVNQAKGRVDFDFNLSGKGTASWEVLTGVGENEGSVLNVPLFPTGGSFPNGTPGFTVDPARGELICFAVDQAGQNQIAYNHLTGTATEVDDAIKTSVLQASFRYDAWSFIARSATINVGASDGTVQGTPGNLQLTGGGAGTYDGCPLYNVASFMPNVSTLPSSGLETFDNGLSVVSCNQDLRQDFILHITKLQFTIWNSRESSFSGTYQCVDSVAAVDLSPANPNLVVPTNFNFTVLGTNDARFQVQGVASTQCPVPVPSENAGLLGVLTSSVGFPGTTATAVLGSTTFDIGLVSGFVLWDPAGSVGATARHHL